MDSADHKDKLTTNPASTYKTTELFHTQNTAGVLYSYSLRTTVNSNGQPLQILNPVLVESKSGPRFFATKTLGAGNFCQALCFQSEGDKQFLMKAPLDSEDAPRRINNRRNEMALYQRAYPETSPFDIHTFYYDNQFSGRTQGYFVVLPYFPGETLKSLMNTTQSEQELLEMYLAVVEGLQSIHNHGVIHGDVKNDNIIVHRDPETQQFSVRYVDFEWGYLLKDEYARTSNLNHEETPHFAPERTASSMYPRPAPQSNQDIYSLGYDMELFATSTKISLPRCLASFAHAAVSENPAERPALANIAAGIRLRLHELKTKVLGSEVSVTEGLLSLRGTERYVPMAASPSPAASTADPHIFISKAKKSKTPAASRRTPEPQPIK